MKNRSYGRALALQAIYCWSVSACSVDALLNFDWVPRNSLPREKGIDLSIVRTFAAQLIKGTIDHIKVIDSLFEPLSTNWRGDRMRLVDKSLLRIGSYEILYTPDTPDVVAINEIVELAKQYSDTHSSSFVNGILDALRHNKEQGKYQALLGDTHQKKSTYDN